MANYRVQNVPDGARDTSENCPECGPWIKHWISQADDSFDPLMCANTDCLNEAELGGHVYLEGNGRKMWIIPICTECNELDTSYISHHRPYAAEH